MSYFEGQASGEAQHLLAKLEGNMTLLGSDDQGFVLGCRSHLNEGAVLTQENQQQLRRIAATVNTGAPDMGGIATSEPTLSVLQILKKLAGARHTLNPEEMRFANLMATKYKQKTPLTAEELQKLMTLYTLKGF